MNDLSYIFPPTTATVTDLAGASCYINMGRPWWSIPPYAPTSVPAAVIQDPFTEERLRQIVAEEVAKALASQKEEDKS